MNTRRVIIVAISLLLLVGLALATKLFFLDRQTNSVSALRVDSVPPAEIFINNKSAGQTPYSNDQLPPGEYLLKLSVTGSADTYFPWETKIKLTSGSLTYVSRDIGKTNEDSGDQILWLEKLPKSSSTEVAVVSDPDGASINVDQVDRGLTSTIIKDLSPGDHEITVSKDGYSDQVVRGKLIAGFRLNVIVKLARILVNNNLNLTGSVATQSAVATPSAITPASASGIQKPYVIIEETGTGFLRVRSSASLAGTESARVKPGEKYPMLAEISGWVQIKLANLSGWVSDQYVQKVK